MVVVDLSQPAPPQHRLKEISSDVSTFQLISVLSDVIEGET